MITLISHQKTVAKNFEAKNIEKTEAKNVEDRSQERSGQKLRT